MKKLCAFRFRPTVFRRSLALVSFYNLNKIGGGTKRLALRLECASRFLAFSPFFVCGGKRLKGNYYPKICKTARRLMIPLCSVASVALVWFQSPTEIIAESCLNASKEFLLVQQEIQ